MKKILIIGLVQYGYNTDWYQYSECLADYYDVYYLCANNGKPIRLSEKVHVNYFGTSLLGWRGALFREAWRLVKENDFKKVVVYTFALSFLLRLFIPKKKLVMDIRTSYICSPLKSFLLNREILFESFFYDKVSVISWGVSSFLGLHKKKCRLLPLGAIPGVQSDKTIVIGMKLMYVGTFYDRHIENTVEGTALFLRNHPSLSPDDFTYYIIGCGSDYDIKLIQGTIDKYGIDKYVKFEGEKRFEKLIPYFEKCNIGVCYVPMTDYYDCQPPTKTFEYLLNSMVVLGTRTCENRAVLNDSNGVLIDDTIEGFAKGLDDFFKQQAKYRYESIYKNSLQYSWRKLTEKYMLPIIEE